MQIIKDLTAKAIFYTKVGNGGSKEFKSIDNQVESAKSYAKSKGWDLDEIFIDDFSIDNYYRPQLYKIRDKASIKSQNYFTPKRLLMPELIPISNGKPGMLVKKRTAFQNMLYYIHENPVDVLLISKMHSLFKNMKDLVIFIDNELNPRGIDLQTISKDIRMGSVEAKELLTLAD